LSITEPYRLQSYHGIYVKSNRKKTKQSGFHGSRMMMGINCYYYYYYYYYYYWFV